MTDRLSKLNAIKSRIVQIKQSDHFGEIEKERLVSKLELERHSLTTTKK